MSFILLFPTLVSAEIQKGNFRAPAPDTANILKVRKQIFSAKNSVEYRQAAKKVQKMGKDAIAGLMTIAKDKNASGESRWLALMELGKLGGPTSAPFAKQLFNEKDWMVRSAAIQVVAGVGEKSYWKDLVGFLRDPSLVVRIHAVNALEKLDAKEAAPELLRELRSRKNKHRGKNLWIQKHIIRALGKFRHKQALKQLKEMRERKGFSELTPALDSAIKDIEKS